MFSDTAMINSSVCDIMMEAVPVQMASSIAIKRHLRMVLTLRCKLHTLYMACHLCKVRQGC